jgi:hypothetical protein
MRKARNRTDAAPEASFRQPARNNCQRFIDRRPLYNSHDIGLRGLEARGGCRQSLRRIDARKRFYPDQLRITWSSLDSYGVRGWTTKTLH